MKPILTKSTLNSTAVQELRNMIKKKIQPWQAIQIFHAHVDPKNITAKKTRASVNNLTEIISKRAKSCALVGNSGILLNSSCGDLIDASDLIVRMNLAKFGHEYSSDVGSKVTFMTINGEQCKLLQACLRNDGKLANESSSEWLERNLTGKCGGVIDRLGLLKNDSVLWPARGRRTYRMIIDILPLLRKQFHLHFSVGINYVSLIGTAQRLWHFRNPSSGSSLLAPMTQLCDEISLFGFYPFYIDDYNRTIPHHYYEPEVKMNYKRNSHRMPNEYKFLLDLENKHAIRIINNCSTTNHFI
ncbi:CMP-N-acetylneuraminate-poly-alpha-2,8-sialyltransferase-like [Lytechinus variegatus]|uniref:CMP-N-acetylneuraminate-poly-alpha-2, 8-sialyltransferase-like n=1 Tax=Lytechinus variegatus TaxID=7654 RepID=UPI001BB1982B|nr:CMP-N-acetylneuraminate-poly-alpha-2,8-sialyltransferase-like [Lytechinus variegatus]